MQFNLLHLDREESDQDRQKYDLEIFPIQQDPQSTIFYLIRYFEVSYQRDTNFIYVLILIESINLLIYEEIAYDKPNCFILFF